MFIAYERLLGLNYLRTTGNDAQATSSRAKWDLMTGANHTDASPFQAWMWKRHAGFDVVTYEGNGTLGKQISHNLSKTPEMIWIKNRGETANWIAYHKGLNGGTNPEKYYLRLNTTDSEIYLPDLGVASNILFNDTAPTSTVVTLGSSGNLNKNGFNHIMMLFASVDGISKVGYYTGDGVTNRIVSVGFNPRFLMVKRADSTGDWYVLDTTRGFDKNLFINTNAAETGGQQAANTSASGGGFVMGSGSSLNVDTQEFIYYAHA